jgi:AcrR family transcriptional regulator
LAPSADETREAILDAAEELLRHHGAARTGVVDVARALRMSHANVYRFFSSKAALFDAVAERWLVRDAEPLYAVALARGKAGNRLHRWILAIYRHKRRKVIDEPELFAFYKSLVAETAHDFVARHTKDLAAQLGRILDDGIAAGEFRIRHRQQAIGTILDATASLRHPAIVADRKALDEKRVKAVAAMIVASLRAGAL